MGNNKFEDFKSAHDYFYGQKNHRWDLGLSNIKKFLEKIGSPEEKINIIQVAGTNGKGSVSTFLSNILMERFKKVGRYNSPVVFEERENITVNNVPMSEDDFLNMVNILYEPMEEAIKDEILPTIFELETVMAILYFYKMDCDLVILEAGLGGRDDATNVSTHNILSVITSISMDHTNYLGDTLQAIASVKAGIIKPDKDGYVKVAVGANSESVLEIIRDRAVKAANDRIINDTRELQGKADILNSVYCVTVDDREISKLQLPDEGGHRITYDDTSLLNQCFVYKGEEYCIKLLGQYQQENAALAIEAARLLNIDDEAIKHGLMKAYIFGRFQVIQGEEFYTVIDGAHNPDAAARLKENIDIYFGGLNIVTIMGVFGDKNYRQMIDIMKPYLTHSIAVNADSARALTAEELKLTIERACDDGNEDINKSGDKVCDICTASDYGTAYKLAKEKLKKLCESNGKKGAIVAFGSLSYLKHILKYANIDGVF